MHYTINQLAKMAKISADQLFQILLDCSHVCGQDGVYAVADSGRALGGIDCELPRYEYGVMFPRSLLDDSSVKEGIQDCKTTNIPPQLAVELPKQNCLMAWVAIQDRALKKFGHSQQLTAKEYCEICSDIKKEKKSEQQNEAKKTSDRNNCNCLVKSTTKA